MGKTRDVLEKMKIMDLGRNEGFDVRVLDEEGIDEWLKIDKEDPRRLRGFYISKIFTDADKVVQTCCLQAHRFGGHSHFHSKILLVLWPKRSRGGSITTWASFIYPLTRGV